MMGRCVVVGCNSYSKKNFHLKTAFGPKMTYYKFPKNKARIQQWLEACGIDEIPYDTGILFAFIKIK